MGGCGLVGGGCGIGDVVVISYVLDKIFRWYLQSC